MPNYQCTSKAYKIPDEEQTAPLKVQHNHTCVITNLDNSRSIRSQSLGTQFICFVFVVAAAVSLVDKNPQGTQRFVCTSPICTENAEQTPMGSGRTEQRSDRTLQSQGRAGLR